MRKLSDTDLYVMYLGWLKLPVRELDADGKLVGEISVPDGEEVRFLVRPRQGSYALYRAYNTPRGVEIAQSITFLHSQVQETRYRAILELGAIQMAEIEGYHK